MIRRSRLVLSLSVVAAMAAHAAGLWVSDSREKIEVEGGAGAVEAVLGSSFADMVAGAAQPVSDATVTHSRQPDNAITPIQPDEALRPDPPETAHTPPPPGATPPARIAALAEAVLPKVDAQSSETVEITRASEPETTIPAAQTARADPVRTKAVTAPARQQAVVDAVSGAGEGLQVSRRPQPRPREIELAAARQSPEPERRTKPSGNSGSNAARDATRGSATGRETATAAQQGRNTASRSDAKGNAAASNYPGLVMRHLARVPRPRAEARGAALVQFMIADGGRLASVGLARSSGSAGLDRAALAVVQNAAPFPAPPSGARRSFSVEIRAR